MADNLELQQRIARLAGRINRHKNQQAGTTPAPAPTPQSHPQPSTFRGSHQQWVPARGTPYGSPRGRGYGYRATGHKHRTLIVNNHSPNATDSKDTEGANTSSPGWVVKRDRHMQLINNNVYDQKVQERTKAMAETRQQREQLREERQKSKIDSHLRSIGAQQADQPAATDTAPARHIVIKDIKFLVVDGGSKLIRSQDEVNVGKQTPKRANVGGVTFMRSKHGNLYRSGLVKTMRTRVGAPKSAQLCPTFCSTGTCPKGPGCRYTHDADKTAICRDFLSGKCTAGEFCDLSHAPTPERMPSCLHFMRGNCTNDDCKYPHVRVNPGAPVCRAFAVLGFCSQGTACAERHVHECPDYSNKGMCRNKRCRLPHVDRAGQLRKAAAAAAHSGDDLSQDGDSSADVSSDEELADMDSDDVDSDGFEELVVHADHQLAEQSDFVKF